MSLMLAAAAAVAAEAQTATEPVELGWNWEQPHRWFLETEVSLPLFMWFQTPFNHQARATAFHLSLIADCAPGTPMTARVSEVVCRLEDVALSASPMAQERRLMQPIVTELDDLLTGAEVQLQVREDGRLTNLDLEGVYRRNQRGGEVVETLRLVLSRAFAAIDLEVPRSGDRQWLENTPWLMMAPVSDGNAGLAQVVHTVVSEDGAFAVVASEGMGVMVPGQAGTNRYDTRYAGTTTWDVRQRAIVDRVWTVIGVPTASSSIATGAAGYPYVQRGRLVALGEGQAWPLPESVELDPVDAAQSAIQADEWMGVTPRR